MFVGHAAVALAARPLVPRRSLGLLFAAVFWLDLVWPVLLLLGVESVRIEPGATAFTPLDFVHYPWTHSLLATAVWSGLFSLVATRSKLVPVRDAVLLALLVSSHWLLDFVTHRPDLPLAPGGEARFGLGLWNSVPATFVVEGALFAAGIWVYARTTRARDRIGSLGFWGLIAFLTAVWIAGPFSPPPPSAAAIGVVGLATWLIPLWAWSVDRRRAPAAARNR